MRQIRVPFALPSISRAEIAAVERTLRSGWLTSGPEAHRFEQEFAAHLNKHPANAALPPLHTLSTQSCSAGLHLAIEALRLPKDTPVLLSPYTFTSTASAVLHTGREIEFIDIDSTSFLPNPQTLKKKLSEKKYSALILPQITGTIPAEYPELLRIARAKKMKIIEDAAHSFPAWDDTGYFGTGGDVGVYSFYANKTITTGEGGMLVSRNSALIERISVLRNNGISPSTWQRHSDPLTQKSNSYDIVDLGFKYTMSDILAAIGRVQLQRSETLHKKRIALAKRYVKLLSQRDCWKLPELPSNPFSHSWHLFILRIQHKKYTRDVFAAKLADLGIETSMHYRPLHMMHYYKKRYLLSPKDFPNAFSRYQSALSLPIYPDLKMESLERVCNMLIKIADT